MTGYCIYLEFITGSTLDMNVPKGQCHIEMPLRPTGVSRKKLQMITFTLRSSGIIRERIPLTATSTFGLTISYRSLQPEIAEVVEIH